MEMGMEMEMEMKRVSVLDPKIFRKVIAKVILQLRSELLKRNKDIGVSTSKSITLLSELNNGHPDLERNAFRILGQILNLDFDDVDYDAIIGTILPPGFYYH